MINMDLFRVYLEQWLILLYLYPLIYLVIAFLRRRDVEDES